MGSQLGIGASIIGLRMKIIGVPVRMSLWLWSTFNFWKPSAAGGVKIAPIDSLLICTILTSIEYFNSLILIRMLRWVTIAIFLLYAWINVFTKCCDHVPYYQEWSIPLHNNLGCHCWLRKMEPKLSLLVLNRFNVIKWIHIWRFLICSISKGISMHQNMSYLNFVNKITMSSWTKQPETIGGVSC